ncbi:unnamed protein product [Urochloa decumbens]|uniref:NB-ARC domain-containing protein n=1 Tax=Urochloa decumbens TaxID=240449 RepID=A0ABC9FIQ9_9POAL
MLLLRVHVVVEEAEQRHITNQALLRDLNLIRKEMYIGCHALDIFVCRDHHKETARDQGQAASSSSTPSRLNPAKRLCFRGGSGSSEQERLHEVLGRLEATIRDASELFVLLSGCPRRCRQPYSMYLLLDNCMFSRQMEMERLMEFLLQEDASSSGDSGAETLAVLPVIGPGRVGKTTIIEHACNDERVRSHFSQIMRFSQDSIRDVKTIATLGDCSVIKLHNRAVGGERTLVIIELTGDIDEHVWAKLYSDCTHQFAIGSKIIVASRSDKIANLGTTQPLTVQSFAEEAYWYFFKVRTFGSADVKDHPKVASIAMDLAREINGRFFSASVFSRLLKDNFDAHFWSMALGIAREFKRKNLLLFGADFVDLWQVVDPVFVRRASNTSSEYFVILDDYQTVSQSVEGPQMSIRDLIFGNNNAKRLRGRFKVLAWRSHIPPHYSYMMTCEVRRPQRMLSSRKKRIQQITR